MNATTSRAPRRRPATPLGERGIALPLALLGLVAVSLLVTTALLTSSTEVAVSDAQRDAAVGLYDANGALERYVAARAGSADINKLVEGTVNANGPSGSAYALSIARLAKIVSQIENPASAQAFSDETFSIVASPSSGRGRSVGAMVRARRTLDKIVLNINAGATSGGDLRVGGSATISDGRDDINCDSAAADNAIQVTAGSQIDTIGNSVDILGQATVTDWGKEELVERILGGVPLDTLAKYANIKFGPRFGRPEWNQTRVNQSYATHPDTIYNWGCPQDLVTGVTCSAANQNRFVIVAIDANGGTARINGDYGQGILLVLNGSLEVQGNFNFRGIVLVDQDLKVGGGSGRFEGKLEGAVVAFGENTYVEDSISGSAVIRFNKCSIVDAQNALNRGKLEDQPQNITQTTFAWFEVVR